MMNVPQLPINISIQNANPHGQDPPCGIDLGHMSPQDRLSLVW